MAQKLPDYRLTFFFRFWLKIFFCNLSFKWTKEIETASFLCRKMFATLFLWYKHICLHFLLVQNQCELQEISTWAYSLGYTLGLHFGLYFGVALWAYTLGYTLGYTFGLHFWFRISVNCRVTPWGSSYFFYLSSSFFTNLAVPFGHKIITMFAL